MLKKIALICLTCSLNATEYYSMTEEQEWVVMEYIEDYVNRMGCNERQMWLQDVVRDFERRDQYNQFQLYEVQNME